MSKKRLICILAVSMAVASMFISCRKTCRCYRYDGDIVEFSVDELEENDMTCDLMEEVDFGLTYSLCERVLF